MKRNKLVLTFTLVSLILSLVIGCQRQSATAPNVEQKAELCLKTNQSAKPTPRDSKPTLEIEETSPRIAFEKTVHNFSELGIREKGECEFKFKNTGNDLLKIGKINATCGCTVPSLSSTEFKPGEEGVVKVKYSGQSKAGSVAKNIYVPTNDRENSKVKLTIKAKVVQRVEVTPWKFQLSLSKENASKKSRNLSQKPTFPIKISTALTTNT